MEELFDICTPEGVPIGERIARSDAHTPGSRHRTAHVWVVRSLDGQDTVKALLSAFEVDF